MSNRLHQDTHRSFPLITKGMTKGYEFTQQYQPEIADLIRQIFYIIMKPFVALKAKLYRTILKPFRSLVGPNVPIFRISIIIIGFSLIYFECLSITFSVNQPLAFDSSPAENISEEEKEYRARTVNEYAPVSAGYLKETTTDQYILRYKDLAINEMKKYGIPASITLGQAIIESRAGNSRLAVNNKNHFGIKCFSKKCKKGHCSNHFDDHHKDFFRIYDSTWQSFRDHSKLLQKNRYKRLKSYGKDYKKWSRGLKACGYATDKKYDKKLIGIIKKYKLYQYDK